MRGALRIQRRKVCCVAVCAMLDNNVLDCNSLIPAIGNTLGALVLIVVSLFVAVSVLFVFLLTSLKQQGKIIPEVTVALCDYLARLDDCLRSRG